MRRYLIFGGTGSLGKKLIQRLLPEGNSVTVYSRDEAKHWALRNEFSDNPQASKLRFCVGDIRDLSRVKEAIKQVDPHVIIIAAALKQVDTCELSPFESIQTNTLGTHNVIKAVDEHGTLFRKLEKVLFVSTDKAASPVNVYGMCKAISERIVTSQASTGHSHIKYLCVRYGNVLESRGSIVPLFKWQAEHNECLTVTDPNMTRFVMTLDDSVDLINHTLEHGASGETWIPRLPAMRIGDLADIFARKSGKHIKVIGLRPGEKRDEDLVNESEAVRARSTPDERHYVIDPAFKAGSGQRFNYTSNQQVMTPVQLETHLSKLGILEKPIEDFVGKSVEEIMTNRGKE